MNCIVPGRGIRAFGKAVQCLAKIGEDLHIEALEKGLSLRTVNSARSAFVNFLFCRKFFNSYSDGLGSRSAGDGVGRRSGVEEEEEEDEEEDTIKCKITIKSVLSVFRSLSTLEKTVDYFSLYIDCKLSKLVFIFHCRHGIVKTHQLGFQECDSLRAVFAKDLSPNHIKLQSRILGEVVGNFPNFLEEVTLLADPECVRLKNYCKEDSVDQRATMTEVCLVPAEFDDYQIGVDAAITFCLKELRAVLLFTDALPQTVSLYFESAGSPVVFSIDDTTEVKADFVLATLQDVADPTNPITNGTTAHSDSSTNTAGVRGKNATHRQREQTRQNTRGRRRGTANGRGLTRRQDGGRGSVEDEWSHPFSSSNVRSTKEDRERTSEERLASVESVHGSSQAYHSTPSRQRMADARSRSSRTSEEHCAPGDTVMVEEDGHVTGDGAGGEGVVEGEADPLDALFGEENMMDVGEGGWEGGRGGDFAAEGRPRSSTSEPQHTLPGIGISRSPHVVSSHLTSSCVRPSPKSPQAHTSHPHTPPSPTLPRREGEEERRRGEEGGVSLTQDSILQDSGFLPGTPPAKKFKAWSAILGGGLLHSDLPTPRQPGILAPDSEDESN